MPDINERFPSARDIEKVARNPECQTLRTALAANVDLRKYAIEIGLQDEKQSPIALGRGRQVERFVLGNSAQRLVDRFVEDEKIGAAPKVTDLGKRQPNRAGLERGAEETERHLVALLSGADVPDILIHPVLRIRLGDDTQFIEPDALVRYRGASVYEPLELKSYPYRYGKTDPENLRQARRQGAVYVLALRRRIEALGGNPLLIPASVTLVFTRLGSMFPAPIYHESVSGEMRDATHAVMLLETAKQELPTLLEKAGDVAHLLPTLDIHYSERCLSFCSLAKRCREACASDGNVAILGESPSRALAAAGTLGRAIELLEGATPVDDGEEALAQRLLSIAQNLGPFEVAK